MRLINTSTFEIEEFVDERQVSYAILSHVWEKEEISFTDVEKFNGLKHLKHKHGYIKIAYSCKQAIADGWAYVWVDTCCIDKRSSAELSEAINSMYRWYQQAQVCYVFLSDVNTDDQSDGRVTLEQQFEKSVWFTRGWTLQELLAPASVRFYNRHWSYLGDKRDLTIQISTATRIAEHVLLDPKKVTGVPIGAKMSWAAARKTTRREDRAYSLMGLFNINMPMLYGEGDKAFERLQELIIARYHDQSIFLWSSKTIGPCGILAPSVDCFEGMSAIERLIPSNVPADYALTHTGLSIEVELLPWAAETYLALFDFGLDMPTGLPVKAGIYLRKLEGESGYVRTNLSGASDDILSYLDNFDPNAYHAPKMRKRIRVLQTLDFNLQRARNLRPMRYGFQLHITRACNDRDELPVNNIFKQTKYTKPWGIAMEELHGECVVDQTTGDLELPYGQCGLVAIIKARKKDFDFGYIAFAFDSDFNPVCVLIDQTDPLYKTELPRMVGELRRVIEVLLELPSQHNPSVRMIFNAEWSKTSSCQSGSRVRYIPHYGDSSPLWAIKGNRRSGLHATLFGYKHLSLREGFQQIATLDVTKQWDDPSRNNPKMTWVVRICEYNSAQRVVYNIPGR